LKKKIIFFNGISAAKRHAIAILSDLNKITPKFTADAVTAALLQHLQIGVPFALQ
jgi:hypothetical protein